MPHRSKHAAAASSKSARGASDKKWSFNQLVRSPGKNSSMVINSVKVDEREITDPAPSKAERQAEIERILTLPPGSLSPESIARRERTVHAREERKLQELVNDIDTDRALTAALKLLLRRAGLPVARRD